ncbi:hypothetical protein BUY41_09155 [Staphylococcus cohnii]|uniref:DUF927 domain-containing protein n=1 Tax=Staphylococcus TaxID=1279 RepID=UPI000D1C953F|nr:DUF927 domain-containing protein [Staphylococcus sp. GDY8P196P]MCQ9293263.1 DUF927 domain-containing protein [Staphylococcus cohnii]PTF07116.1 hypothetical protein BUY41_09155 [Staphylococcus cohnii]PTF40768.1 hypothetical protein BUY29_07855 [Staphylococcus cohnii]RIM44587.1 DUF927 domain-containing protein [Staphylococcus cohnii]
MSDENMLDWIEEKQADVTKKESELIPRNYKIEQYNGISHLYKIIPSESENKPDKKIFVTSTIPNVNERYEDIESNEVSYNLKFQDNNHDVNLNVEAEQITDARNLIKLAKNKLDVTSTTSARLVDFINASMREKPPINISVANRLGHIKNYFIYPYKEELETSNIKLFNNDSGYRSLIKAFETKGTLNDYSKNVFNKIKSLPMVMMMVYASLGSVLLHEFKITPFIVEISGRTSTGKTFTLKIAASVWGNDGLITEWNSTKNSIEAQAVFFNSFPLLKDDTRNTHSNFISNTVYNFSGGKTKSRSNTNRTLDEIKTWQNILLSTGEVSMPDMAGEKGGVSGRVITLQDDPYPKDFDFASLAESIDESHGVLGKAFIKQFQSNKDNYHASFKSAQQYFVKKAEDNEVMARLGRCFALMQVTGEILNDIEGFEHDHYRIVDEAYHSMIKNNGNIDKPKQMLEELLQYLDANRNHIEGEGYHDVKSGDVKAIYKRDYLCILGETVKDFLGHEMNTITGEWSRKKYLVESNIGKQKQVKHKSTPYRGYAIKKDVVKKLGFDFTNSYNPTSDYYK